MLSENVFVPDPVDTAAALAWDAAVAAARASLYQHNAAAAGIAAQLRLDVPTSPASQAQAALGATATALTTAINALATVQQTQAEAGSAAQVADAAVLTADADLAAATKKVSDALGAMMASSTTSAVLSATVDGLALRERYRAGGASQPPVWDMATVPFRLHSGDAAIDPQVILPVVGDLDQVTLARLLDDLDDGVDAIADLVAAEGIHHLVGGNLERSGAALEIAASGTVPDDLDVITTPVPGYDVTIRVLVLGDTAPTAPWQGTEPSVVATADPAYAAWLAGLMPDPQRVHLTAVALDGDSRTSLGAVSITADQLELDAIGWLRVAADPGELAARVARVARPLLTRQLGIPATGPVVAVPAPTMPPDGIPLAALLAACAAARRVVSGARALQASDLAAAGEQPAPPTPDVVATTVAAVKTVQAALTALDSDLAAAPSSSGDTLVAVLLRASALGLSEATPTLAVAPVPDDVLRSLAAAARTRLASRLALPPFTVSDAGPDATLAAARDLLPTLCGGPVPLLLPVPLPTAAAVHDDLREGSDPLPGATPAAVRQWLLDYALVRPAVGALLDAHDAAEALGATATLRPRATHLPRQAATTWAGADPAPPPGLIHLVALRTGGLPVPNVVAGLAVDTWVQTVPNLDHDTAVAFHYDEPDADPPQAILLAVAPSTDPARTPAAWDLASLVGVVTSTMGLASDRAVAADLVADATVQIGSGP